MKRFLPPYPVVYTFSKRKNIFPTKVTHVSEINISYEGKAVLN